MLLSEQCVQKIDREVAKYPADQKQSAVMAAWPSRRTNRAGCRRKRCRTSPTTSACRPIAVQEVTTFYNMYNHQPVGKHKITVCTNLPCALSRRRAAPPHHLKQKLGIDFGETTADGLFTLQEGECLGACGDAPVMLVNNHAHVQLHEPNDKIDAAGGGT